MGSDATDSSYVSPSTDWLADCRFGIGLHGTARSAPRRGKPLAFQESVAAYDVAATVDMIASTGADYLLLTITHALQMLAAPHPVIDRLLAGRTCERDLLGEIADALAARGLRFLLYYNHSCNSGEDAAWEQAVGYHDPDKDRFADNLCEIVTELGRRYGDRFQAWWFDSCYSVDPRGPHNSVTTDLGAWRFPWERFTQAAKTGYADRLVAYNAGVDETYLYTTHQDYWAGEMIDLDHPPTRRTADNGLQWHGWTCLDDRRWVHTELDTEIPDVLYTDDELVAFVRTCRAHRAPMTFNVGVYQGGMLSEPSVAQLRRLDTALGGRHR